MSLDYTKVWNAMNDLDDTITNYVHIKELLQSYNKKNDKFIDCIITLLDHYIDLQDQTFKVAWSETVNKINSSEQESVTICDKDNPSDECKNSWNDFWEENYYPEDYSLSDTKSHSECYYEYNRNDLNRENPFHSKDDGMRPWGHSDMEYLIANKPKRWILPIEKQVIDGVDDYYIMFPDELLEAANIKQNDVLEWIDQGDGSWLLKKVEE